MRDDPCLQDAAVTLDPLRTDAAVRLSA